ncbi:uncharacterized protein [Diadema antillarum]|uniref:uncharacterized protein n=1 Tax=Diadema antillarum TaxID=105358 RepID=UPI003A88EC49
MVLWDFLILRILFANAQRSGVISTITIGHFNDATSEVVKGKHVLKIREHKTRRKFGDVNLVIDSALWRWMTIYREKGRPLTPGYSFESEGKDSPFFLSNTGTKMTKLGQTLGRRGKMLGLASEKMLPTNIRKTVVTMAHEDLSPRKRERLANFMCHGVPVQQSYYKARQKVTCNIQASLDVANLMTLEDNPETDQSVSAIPADNPDNPADTDSLPIIPPTEGTSVQCDASAASDMDHLKAKPKFRVHLQRRR